MRVLLFQSKSISKIEELTFPIGLCYVATALIDQGHEVNIYDTNVRNDSAVNLSKIVRNFEPDIIGVGFRNLDNPSFVFYHHYFKPFLELVDILKQAAPDSRIIAGGSGFSLYAQQLMERVPALDFGVFNEGEEAMPELLDNLNQPESVKGVFYRNNGIIQFTGFRKPIDFANFPAPRHDLLDLKPYLQHPYSIGIQVKRGCPFKCIYCNYPYLQGTELRTRSTHAVLDELDELVKNHGLRSFTFVDSVFNFPPTHTREILEGMLNRGLNLQWQGFDNIKFVDAEYLKLAREAGCNHFTFSPDGATTRTLKALNKETTEQDIERVYSAAKHLDRIKVSFCFFVNGPGESIGNILRLIFFILRCTLVLRMKVTTPSLHTIRVYPHTQLHTLTLDKGLVKKEDDLFMPVFYNPPPLRYFLAILTPAMKLGYKTVRAITKLLSA